MKENFHGKDLRTWQVCSQLLEHASALHSTHSLWHPGLSQEPVNHVRQLCRLQWSEWEGTRLRPRPLKNAYILGDSPVFARLANQWCLHTNDSCDVVNRLADLVLGSYGNRVKIKHLFTR